MAGSGSNKSRSLLEKGLSHYGRGQIDEALQAWRAALKINPEDEEARRLINLIGEQRAEVEARQASTSAPPGEAAADVSPVDEFKVPTRSTFAAHGTNTGFPPAAPEAVVDPPTRPIGTERMPSQSDPIAGVHPSRSHTPPDMALATARMRAVMHVDKCRLSLAAGEATEAAAAAEEALEEGAKAPAPGIAEVIEPARTLFAQAFAMHVGPELGVPSMAVDVSAASKISFDHRTGFLLSCIDGTLPVQTLLDIAGMGRFDLLRALSGLLRRRIIRF